MKELKEQELLDLYIQSFKLRSIFNERLLRYLSLYSFNKDEIICTQGEPSQYLYVLVKGKVKVSTSSAEGKTLILSFKTPLEVIGDIEYVQNINFINTVEAVSSVCMIGIHYQSLKKYGEHDSMFLQFLLEIITRKFHIKSNSLSFNLMHPVEVRLASYLLSMSFDKSDSLYRSDGNIVSLKDTAGLIGTSYRHLNRVIQRFCKEGLIERVEGCILVKDREGLQALTGNNIYE